MTDGGHIAFVDCETTGLDPDLHEIWEVGLIVRAGDGHTDTEYRWLLPVDLGRADPVALRIGGFHHRHPQGSRYDPAKEQDGQPLPYPRGRSGGQSVAGFARSFARLTEGRHLAGAVVSFDEERLRKLLRANGACPEWHYHLADVEALAAGRLRRDPPWDSEGLSKAIGIDPGDYDRHTALGDARWARDLYDAVMGP